MKKIFLLLVTASTFTSCVTEDENCGCTPPPGQDEALIINLKNKQGENLLFKNSSGYVPVDQYTFYLITGDNTINLTKSQGNNLIFELFEENDLAHIVFDYGWYMKKDNDTKDGKFVIDYNNIYPNDTIYMKYTVTPWVESDKLLEVKLNNILVKPDSLHYNQKTLDVIK